LTLKHMSLAMKDNIIAMTCKNELVQ